MVDLRALKSRNFALGCFFSFMTGVGIFATIYLTPLFLGRVRGFSALQIGLAVFSTGDFPDLAIPVYTFLARKIDLRWLMLFGLACFTFSMWNFTPITHDWGWRELLIPQAFRGFSQQFAVAPTVTLTLGAIPPERLKLASAVQPDAEPGRRDRHRRLRHDPERSHQPALPAVGGAPQQHQHRDGRTCLAGRREGRCTAAAAMRCMGHAIALRQLWTLTMREAQTRDLFGCIPGADAVPRPGDGDGAVDAESGASQSAGSRRALTPVAAKSSRSGRCHAFPVSANLGLTERTRVGWRRCGFGRTTRWIRTWL